MSPCPARCCTSSRREAGSRSNISATGRNPPSGAVTGEGRSLAPPGHTFPALSYSENWASSSDHSLCRWPVRLGKKLGRMHAANISLARNANKAARYHMAMPPRPGAGPSQRPTIARLEAAAAIREPPASVLQARSPIRQRLGSPASPFDAPAHDFIRIRRQEGKQLMLAVLALADASPRPPDRGHWTICSKLHANSDGCSSSVSCGSFGRVGNRKRR
jgi:hypothetical protein